MQPTHAKRNARIAERAMRARRMCSNASSRASGARVNDRCSRCALVACAWTIVRPLRGADVRVTMCIVLLGAAVVVPSRAWSQSPVSVTFTTSPTPYEDYAPRNVVAVWVEDDAGGFVKTLMRYGVKRAEYLLAWEDVAADRSEIDGDPDVITGATRSGHGALTVTWNLVDWHGNPVADGTYRIHFELTDHNSSSQPAN